MKITLFSAISLNGMIARKNGEEDFLSDANWDLFCNLAKDKGCVILGRRTYENLKSWGKSYTKKLDGVKKIIISSKKIEEKDIFNAEKPEKATEIIEKQGFSEAVLGGGSLTNSSFADLNLIDEAIINIEPIIVPEGIPMLSKNNVELDLELLNVKEISEDIVQLHYKVNKE